MQYLPELEQGTVSEADERGVNLVRVTLTETHGDYPEGHTLRVDPASAESLVSRGLATAEGLPAAPAPEDPEDEKDEGGPDPQDVGDPVLPLQEDEDTPSD